MSQCDVSGSCELSGLRIHQVLGLIEAQLSRVDQRINALLLVGGFAGSEYLKQRVKEEFGSRIDVIARPPDADTATLRGAAAYGLAKRPLVSSVIAPRSYVMKVKFPAENEDWLKRPAYIKHNDAGVQICENRFVKSF
jgi:molecular chaperone DnaK (HSP70)